MLVLCRTHISGQEITHGTGQTGIQQGTYRAGPDAAGHDDISRAGDVAECQHFFKEPWLTEEACLYKAESTGYRRPKEQFWKVAQHTTSGGMVDDERVMRYDDMLRFMRAVELRAARKAGFSGPYKKEVEAQRRDSVPATNILKFI